MKVVAFNGSARKDGNTAIMVRTVLRVLEEAGIQTELIQLAEKDISGCKACYGCVKKKNGKCAVAKDDLNEMLNRMVEADGIILASPTYFADVTSAMKALIDRCGMVSRANGDLLKRKVGAAIVVARRGGAIHAFDSMNHFFLIGQMIVVGSNYWNMGFGLNIGEVNADQDGLNTMRVLGENMAWLLNRLSA
uniref:Flavodoxin family protein n=1 Tax=Desulfatirhabdium butyrativorans TaxID=340467 RepID=A0A7C4RUP5_9BACT